ncbi:DsrE family protein [Magnetospirillum sp. UT-4]|uniref:DsrE family protein n=1 Tax=Magnetospirillum sp. UT-4 TaxID=2681467 RepID=UPI001380AEB3|nr:DsrE family protein [Magnetospirillum sp. UT-4]CAA7613395.1 conserved exported hypothetical protein [Magnetospirillum sp. UT-4]
MRVLFAVLAIALAAALPARAGDTRIADPKPGWDNPRKVMLQLTSDEPRHVNNVLYNAVNVLDFYGQDNAKVAIIAYAAGVRALLKESSPVAERVASLKDYEVEFVACGNTLKTIGKTEKDLLPGVTVVTAGIPEIIERKMTGWHYITP